jgi:hypothetical protein
VPEVVLEGVRDPPVVEADVRRAFVEEDLVAHRLLEQAVEFTVVAEDDVPPFVPGEALRVYV